MDTQRTDILAPQASVSYVDRALECLMAAMLAFMPFALGVVGAWSEEIVVLLSGAMVLCLLGKAAVRRDGGLVWTWAYVPLALFVLLAVIQLIPMPPGLVAFISPGTAEMKTSLASGLSGSARAGQSMAVSFYPLATERSLRLVLVVSAVFVVAVNLYRRPEQIKRLLTVIVIIGGVAAVLALAQVITGTKKIFWHISAGTAMGGPFVNRNNYCQFMALCMGAGLGLLLLRLNSVLHGTPVTVSRVVERLGSRELRPVWYLSGMIVFGAASIFLSLSRGGMVSLLIAWAVTVAVLALKKRLDGWGWIMSALAMGAFACVLYVSFDSVYDRLASLRNVGEFGGRWALACDGIGIWAKFPLLGVGLGAHEYIYPMFDQSVIPATATHIENEYIQVAEECGLVGLILVAAFGAIILRAYVRCVRRDGAGVRIVALGLGAGLLAVVIHSVSDFGLHLPAIACLAAVFCGLLVNMARPSREPAPRGPRRPPLRLLAAGCVILALAAWAWAWNGAHAARRGEAYWCKAQRLERQMRQENWSVASADYARLIALTEQAVRWQPRNVLYRHWLSVHRWRAVSRVSRPETGGVVLGPVAIGCAKKLVADLKRTSALCLTFGPSYSLAGQLKWLVLGDPGGAKLIRQGRALAPCDPATCFAEGMLDAWEGSDAASLAAFRRALALDGGWFDRIVKTYVFHAARPDLAIEIARGNAKRLLAVAWILDQQGDASLAARVRQDAIAALKTECTAPDVSAPALAQAGGICLRQKEYDLAAKYYRRALFRECGNVVWRLDFARALAATGQVPQAREQVGICLQLRPGMPEAKRLIADLRARSVGGSDAS